MIAASRHRTGVDSARRGTVLIVAMWIVLVLAGLVLVFARVIRVEATASANHVAELQAAAVARGALQFLLAQVEGTEGTPPSEDDVVCEAVQVGEGFFWLLAPEFEDDRVYAFRIVDEASKINLNSAPIEMLLELPEMTAELAAAVQDWRDPDDEISEGGAESEYYLLLEDPYYCKNGPFETVEEILLLKDASFELLYNEDTNRNGVLDLNEDDASDTEPEDNRDGHLDRGLWDYLTVYSSEPNTDASGEPRVNVNDPDTGPVADVLREVVPEDRFFQIMDAVRRGRPYDNVLDFYFSVGLTSEEFEQVADRLTTADEEERVGLINVNTAPLEVLVCLPGLDESDAEALVAARAESDEAPTGIAWVADVLDQEKAEGIGSYITSRSFQFSADIVSVSGDGRAYRRYRAVVDARDGTPRVVYWKEMTSLGWPLAPEIRSTLRSGEELPEVSFGTGTRGTG
jgi:type II secretory pathway component PulK